MNNKTPFFSIVIPTRNRADTLKYAVKTILNQDFQDYEIIICNNNSVDDTEEVAKSFLDDKRVKYILSNTDLSMSDNWELAYTKVTGQYVTYIADNDGFIDGALGFMYDLFRLNDYPEIIRLEKNTYNWPCFDLSSRNTLYINLSQDFKVYNSSTIIKEIFEGKRHFKDLPMIYNSFVSNQKIKSFISKAGRLFHSPSPDLSTGFSFALTIKDYLSLSYGIACRANSAKSNGYNCMLKKDNSIYTDFIKLMNISKINFHSNIPLVKSTIAAIMEAYLNVIEALKETKIDLDFKQIYLKIIDEIIIFDEDELEATKSKIIEASKFDDKLHTFIIEYLEKNPLKIKPYKNNKAIKGFNKSNNILVLDGEDFDLHNIEQVCKFMRKFYGYSLHDISFPMISKYNLSILEESSKIAIWGDGEFGRKCQNLIKESRSDITIKYIIDSFFEDKRAIPKIIKPLNIPNNLHYIIIASSFMKEISNTIIELGLNKKYKILKYYE